jgi:hypothetical protein
MNWNRMKPRPGLCSLCFPQLEFGHRFARSEAPQESLETPTHDAYHRFLLRVAASIAGVGLEVDVGERPLAALRGPAEPESYRSRPPGRGGSGAGARPRPRIPISVDPVLEDRRQLTCLAISRKSWGRPRLCYTAAAVASTLVSCGACACRRLNLGAVRLALHGMEAPTLVRGQLARLNRGSILLAGRFSDQPRR